MTFDGFMVLMGATLLLIIVGILINAAYRLGHANGAIFERLRRKEVEERVERRVDEEKAIANWMEDHGWELEKWEEELDA